MATQLILIDKTLHEEAADILRDHGAVLVLDTNQLPGHLLDHVTALAIRTNTTIDKALLDRLPHLEIVATATTGTNHIDTQACEQRGVQVIDAKGANADSVADYVFRMLLHATDDAHYTNTELKERPHEFCTIKKHNERKELASMEIGIIGLGNIGTRVAARAAAFGMKVKAYDPYVAEARDTLQDVLGCDVVTIHAELTQETAGMIGQRELALLKKDAVLINSARGEIVDEEALARHLQERPRTRAIIDVFAQEPAPSTLYTLSNCLVTPHIAGNAQEAKRRAARMIAERIIAQLHRPQTPLVVLQEAHA
jgi:D-3-phosphoglycerate dehydrogenase